MIFKALKKLTKTVRFSIRLTVVAVFVLATSITAIIATSLQYYFSEKMALESNVQHFNMTTQSVADYLTRINEKSENTLYMMVKNTSLVGENLSDKTELRNVLSEMMDLNPLFYAFYMGYNNGDFFEVINLESSAMIRQRLGATDNDRWVVIQIKSEEGQRIQQTLYFDASFSLREKTKKPTYFDPREQAWFKQANSQQVNKTKPYLFTHLQTSGQTYSIKIAGKNHVLGLGIIVDNMSNYLIEQQQRLEMHSSTQLLIYNREGEIIASNQPFSSTVEARLNRLILDEQQQKIVAKYPTITVSNETNWAPMDFSVSGKPKGYSVEYINAIAELLGIKVNYINGLSWQELLNLFENKQIDVIHPVLNTASNNALGMLSIPMVTLPLSIVNQQNNPPITHMQQLAGKSVAVGEGWSIVKILRAQFPEINLVEVPNTKALLMHVANGDTYAGIDSKAVLQYIQQQFFIEGIQYNPLDEDSAALFSNDYHLLFQNQDAQLKALFDYAATQLPLQFKQQLSDKWLNTNSGKKSKIVGTVPDEQLITLLDDDSNFSKLQLVNINGKEQYVFIKPLSDYLALASTGYLAIMVSKEDVLSSTREKIKLSIIITVACLIMMLPVSWFFASPIVGPIKTLVGENNKIKNRQFKQVSTLKSHIKEINTLAYSMVDMSKSIQQHEDSQKALMASFIELIAQAIDDKSPYTAGHCERVPELGIELAKAASESELPAFKGFKFKNDDEVEEFSLAAWLHDCGKITTPEHIVDKGTKLETIYNRIHEIRTRFEVLWRDAELDYYKSLQHSPQNQLDLTKQLAAKQQQLLDDFAFIAQCNIGGEKITEAALERLTALSNITWQRHFDDKLGLSPVEMYRYEGTDDTLPITEKLLSDKPWHLIPHDKPIEYDERLGIKIAPCKYKYNLGELYNLTVSRGTLTKEDRFKINEHMISTIRMLDTLPFPKELERVPRYASTHHETLIGTGYPRKLNADDLSIPERVLVLADIFEALTAADRPYKKAKTLSESMSILAKMVADHHVDKAVFKLFLSSGIYLDYAKRYLSAEQIDEVDISQYLS
jgi:HD-GYP domain-containing protein (c-di-GMP phosphodiesterase class II)/ABC-type amino acid transport substrate-binding protein